MWSNAMISFLHMQSIKKKNLMYTNLFFNVYFPSFQFAPSRTLTSLSTFPHFTCNSTSMTPPPVYDCVEQCLLGFREVFPELYFFDSEFADPPFWNGPKGPGLLLRWEGLPLSRGWVGSSQMVSGWMVGWILNNITKYECITFKISLTIARDQTRLNKHDKSN